VSGSGICWAICKSAPHPKAEAEVKQNLTSHQKHYASYRGRVFTSQMTQPTASKHWKKIGP